MGNKKCEIPFHHLLSARSLGSIYSSCDLAEPIPSIPSLFACTSPSEQAREEPKHGFSGPCCDVLPSSQSLVNDDVGREYHLVRGVYLRKSARKWLKHKSVDDRMPVASSINENQTSPHKISWLRNMAEGLREKK